MKRTVNTVKSPRLMKFAPFAVLFAAVAASLSAEASAREFTRWD